MSTSLYGRVLQINVNPRGGVPKYAVPSAEITLNGVLGDKQRDHRYHGGAERAVSLYALERIEALRAEGHPIGPGTTGENLTLAGIDWARLKIGAHLLIGEWVELELTDFAVPCSTISDSFRNGEFKRMAEKLHPGWSRFYARVLAEGIVRTDDRVMVTL